MGNGTGEFACTAQPDNRQRSPLFVKICTLTPRLNLKSLSLTGFPFAGARLSLTGFPLTGFPPYGLFRLVRQASVAARMIATAVRQNHVGVR